MLDQVKKRMESRMLGNLHVRFGVGVEVELLGLHHLNRELARPEPVEGTRTDGD